MTDVENEGPAAGEYAVLLAILERIGPYRHLSHCGVSVAQG